MSVNNGELWAEIDRSRLSKDVISAKVRWSCQWIKNLNNPLAVARKSPTGDTSN